ncbi:hypothetical protein [Allomuricauda sp. F6463D]|uniref:hypothetical protein n=1 Tax=Allomuricauda sp. F6463D TaxID=2926409 RepID=UPI001FF5D997|nr:hypothetical protein [Muricauda sp. F6463D]MCK0159149.1 hypothetical protein [Muricauda sp. F6463D]
MSSCNLFKENSIEFSIENQSDVIIESITFTTSERRAEKTFDSLQPKKSVFGILLMDQNKMDGSYVLEFTRVNGKKETHNVGYYTNGAPINRWVSFKIQNDTLLHLFSGTGL